MSLYGTKFHIHMAVWDKAEFMFTIFTVNNSVFSTCPKALKYSADLQLYFSAYVSANLVVFSLVYEASKLQHFLV